VSATPGWCQEDLLVDFPGIGLFALPAAADAGARSRVASRLEHLSGRIDGRNVASIPLTPIHAAYRRLARQLGLDPDRDGTPLAPLLRERIIEGRLRSHGDVADACACALLETGVPVFALPFGDVTGDLGLALARGGERLPGDAAPLADRTLVVSDVARPLALALLTQALTPADPGPVVLYAIRAPAVSVLVVEEALWVAAGLLWDAG
jgi:hypothetical protein